MTAAPERIVIGWDISTSAIGICVKAQGYEDVFDVIFPKGETHLEKWRSATVHVEAFMREWRWATLEPDRDGITHIVEERLGGFTGGRTSKQTLMALASMNAVISEKLSWSGNVIHMAPVTTKRIMGLKDLSMDGEDKKDTVVRLARSSCPSFPYAETKAGNWKKGTDDMADAWLLAEAGLRVLRGEASIGRPEKAGGRKGKAGGTKERRPKKG